jgi:hypothetical protein
MGHALGFGADLAHEIGGREIGQHQSGNQYRADDRLGAIQGEIPGGSDEGDQGRNDSLDRKLQQFNRAGARGAYTESNEFGADRDPSVAKQRVTESYVHGIAICISFQKRARHWGRVYTIHDFQL